MSARLEGHTQKKPPSILAFLKKIPLTFGLPQKNPPSTLASLKKIPLKFGLPQFWPPSIKACFLPFLRLCVFFTSFLKNKTYPPPDAPRKGGLLQD